MRWQTAAEQVLLNLIERRRIGLREAESVRLLISDKQAVQAFRALRSMLVHQGWRVGWNKFWQGNVLMGWYGELILIQPLRSAALEIERHQEQARAARKWCEGLIHPDYIENNPLPQKMPLTLTFTEEAPKCMPATSCLPFLNLNSLPTPVSLTSTVESSSPSIADTLGAYGLAPSSVARGRDHVRLLQRLHLDQREQPFVERWRWTKGCGLAQLSDEGRFQIKPELAWARGIEEALLRQEELSQPTVEFLRGVQSDQREAPLLLDAADDGLETLLSELQASGFIERQIDAVRFAVSPGGFPALALSLWGAERT